MRWLPILCVLLGCAPSPAPQSPAPGCGDGRDGSEVVARLGDVQVSRRDVDAAIDRLPVRARGRYDQPPAQRKLAQRVLEERLLCRAAASAGIDTDAVAARAAEEARAARHVDVVESAAVTDEAVRAWYAANEDRYQLEVIDAEHIVVETEEEARALLRELRAGAELADLAMQHSVDRRTAGSGGKLGWIARGRMPQPWTEAAFALPVGGLSEPVEVPGGFALIRVLGRKTTQPLDEVRPGIERKLRQRASAELLQQIGVESAEFLGSLAE